MRLTSVFSLCIASSLGAGQSEEESHVQLLVRTYQRMTKALKGMPDYACSEKISRRIFSAFADRCEYADRWRLEVAVIGGTELFSWPGTAAFQSEDPSAIMGPGPISTGEYAGFARAVFASAAPVYSYGRSETHIGRSTIRYDYRVSQPRSRYLMRSGSERAIVPFHGSFWVDETNDQLLALEVIADDIPQPLDIAVARTRIEYKLTSFGAEEFPFPQSSELTLKTRSGRTIVNRIEFSNCRRYTGEAILKFGHELPGASPGASSLPSIVPAGQKLTVTLDAPIDLAESSAGDPLSATLISSIRIGKKEIPKGAKLLGRLVRSEMDFNAVHALMALEFHEMEAGDQRLKVHGRLRRFEPVTDLIRSSGRKLRREFNIPGMQQEREPAVFLMRNGLIRIPQGFRMTWETR